jgi:arabinogalactan oligomer/maltooligosaccharide transport system permease protein
MAKKSGKNKDFFSEYTISAALTKGDLFTRLSAVVFGCGNLVRGQIVKGLVFLAAEAAYIFYMVTVGIGSLAQLPSLGDYQQEEVWSDELGYFVYTDGDNSMLILLYAVITLFITSAFVLLWTESVKSAYKLQWLKAHNRQVVGFVEDVKTYLDVNLHKTLLALPILGIVTFTIMPLFFMILIAFTNYDRNHLPPGFLFDWVGLENFKVVLNFSGEFGKTFWPVLGWTLIWAVFATFVNYILGMILAMTINRKDVKAKGFWRFCFVLSVAVPQFVTLLVMRTMLANNGAINVLLADLGFIGHGTSLPFFTNVMWARVTLIVVNIWIGIPYTLLTMTGILQNIPADLYESAKVDGANAFITFFKITLPYMLFITAPTLITQFIGNINNFNVIYLLTGGNPATLDYYKGTAGKTDLLVTWLYKLTIDHRDYSYGAVIGILVFVLSIVFSLVAYRQTGSYKNEEGFQ